MYLNNAKTMIKIMNFIMSINFHKMGSIQLLFVKNMIGIIFFLRSSTGRALRPLRNEEILELEENAPLWLRFQARTHGCESVWWMVVLLDSSIWCW